MEGYKYFKSGTGSDIGFGYIGPTAWVLLIVTRKTKLRIASSVSSLICVSIANTCISTKNMYILPFNKTQHVTVNQTCIYECHDQCQSYIIEKALSYILNVLRYFRNNKGRVNRGPFSIIISKGFNIFASFSGLINTAIFSNKKRHTNKITTECYRMLFKEP